MPFSQLLADNYREPDDCVRFAVNIAEMSLRPLRAAIRNNLISFPAQVPVFACQSRADIQWRLAELYFVHNWSCSDLGRRYGVTMERVRQLVSQWARRAAALGYLQEIPAAEAWAEGTDRDMSRSALPPAAVHPALLVEPQVRPAGSAI